MRTLFLMLFASLVLAGQEQKPAEAKPEAQEAKQQAEQAEPESPRANAVRNAERTFYGYIDAGWRFRTDVGGDFNTWRSVVNMGEGPSLLGADLTVQPANTAWLSRLRVLVNSWGPEPYTTARLDAEQDRWYRFTFDYRDYDFFNFLPSFANPLAGVGVAMTQRGWDLTRRSAEAELTLLPTSHFIPFVAWSRGSGDGRGVSNLVSTRNEYTLPMRVYDRADNIRGGVRVEYNRFHATVEQGFVNYRDEQELFPPGITPAFGNTTAPVFGGRAFLTGGYQAIGMRGDAPYTRALVSVSPFSWMNVNGAFLYSQPDTEINFAQAATGSIVSGTALVPGQLLLAMSRAKQPHPSGTVSLELRPHSRVRVFDTYMTDRMHTSGSALLAETIFRTSGSQALPASSAFDRLVSNYNQNELNVLFDITPGMTLRGGHRYVWADTEVPPSIAALSANIDQQFGETRRQTGLAGFTWRTRDRFSLNFDFEGAASDFSYYRTSLHDYRRARLQARYQIAQPLYLTARVHVTDNNRPRPNYTGLGPQLDYDFLSRDASLTLSWTGRKFNVIADYARLTIHSETDFLNPAAPTEPWFSEYRENAHVGTLLVDVPVGSGQLYRPGLQVGGSFYRSSGSRPVQYYQPTARVAVPVYKSVDFNFDWRWYGFTQPFYLYEGFRTHTFVAGLRLKI